MTSGRNAPSPDGDFADQMRQARRRFLARARARAEELDALLSDTVPSPGNVRLTRIREIAHGLAGAAGSFGAHELGRSAEAAERAALAALADAAGAEEALEAAVRALIAGLPGTDEG